MKKEEWEQLYKELSEIRSQFQFPYRDSNTGKNKKIREKGYKEAKWQAERAESLIRRHSEAYYLLVNRGRSTQKTEGSEYANTLFMEEFTQPRYFDHDLHGFLRDIEAKIKSFDAELEIKL